MQACGQLFIPYASRRTEVEVWPLADLHLGNAGADLDRFKQDVEAIRRNPHALWFGLGDMADFIAPDDRRFDASVLDSRVLEVSNLADLGHHLVESVADLLAPIAHRCIGVAIGNHDDTFYRRHHAYHLHDHFIRRLRSASDAAGAPAPVLDFQTCAMFDLVFVRCPAYGKPSITAPRIYRRLSDIPHLQRRPSHNFTTWRTRWVVHHGTGAPRTHGAKANALHRMSLNWDADIYVQAHLHTPEAMPITVLAGNRTCTAIRPRNLLLVRTGSYLRAYSERGGYAERQMLEPSPLGANVITVVPDKRHAFARIAVPFHTQDDDQRGQED